MVESKHAINESNSKQRWLPIVALLYVVFCFGSSNAGVNPMRDEVDSHIDYRDLVMVTNYDLHPISGVYNLEVVQFYDRKSGDVVEAEQLRFVNFGDDDSDSSILATVFYEGLAAVRPDDSKRYGYADVVGEMVIPAQYLHAGPFSGGRATVKVVGEHETKQWGIIDMRGDWVVPPGRYDELDQFRKSRCAFRVGKKWGLLDGRGQVVVSPRFDKPPIFNQGLAAITDTDGRLSYIDRFGDIKIQAPVDAVVAKEFNNGVAWYGVEVAERPDEPINLFNSVVHYGLISIAGNVILPPTYRQVDAFSDGLAAVSLDSDVPMRGDRDPMLFYFEGQKTGPWGYIDAAGKVVIPIKFQRAGPFRDRLARVCVDGKWGYIDPSGEWVIQPRFEWARDFRDGIAEVWLDEWIVYIDRAGTVIIETGKPAVTF